MAKTSNPTEGSPLLLPATLAVGEIASLKQLLCAALRSGTEVTLDPTPIKTVDTASVQLLAAFVNRAKASDMAVNWCGFSEVLTSAATTLGLRRHLGLQTGDGQG